MEEISPIKEILYDEIKKIPEKQIHELLYNDKYDQLINNILTNVFPKLDAIDGKIFEKIGTLTEGLSHYIFTEMLIPTQRKIIHESIDIDIIIPNKKNLKTNPKNVIIIYFAKINDYECIQKKINDLKKIQPYENNIWVVSYMKVDVLCKNYILNQNKNTFSNLFKNIKKLMKNNKDNELKIFKT